MTSPDLLLVCASAFAAVFVLLGVLALLMVVILALFPEKKDAADAAIMAAITSVMQSVYPGTRVTRVEEQK
jgi:hypothetical protein